MRERFRKERFDTERMINVANGLTAVRLLLVPAVVYFLIQADYRRAFLTFVVCGATDLLDGLLARWLRMRSLVGAFLDPVADKVLLSTSFIVMAMVKIVPVWLAVIVIARDVFILVGSALLILLVSVEEINVTASGKLNTVVQVFAVYFLLFLRAYPGAVEAIGPATAMSWSRATVYACAAVSVFSGAVYFSRGIRSLSRSPHPSTRGDER